MKRSITTIILAMLSGMVFAQPLFVPLNQEYNRNLQQQLYSPQLHFHTSIRSYFIPEIQENGINYDSTLDAYRLEKTFNKKWKQKTWDKIFNEDVATLKRPDFSIMANPLIDFSYGQDLSPSGGGQGEATWVNTRGFEIKGSIGSSFGFYTNFHENQAVFPEYLDSYIRKNRVVPGQGLVRNFGSSGGFDYAASEAYIDYHPNKYFNFQLGHGKNFYGDGYRSLLLSDNSFNNLFLKLSASIWHIKYEVLYNQYMDIRERASYETGFRRKYTTTHYISWAISKRVNLSFFDAIVWAAEDSLGNYRGFDLQYVNPIIFMRPVEFSVGSPDNALMGLNLSVIAGKSHVFYGQLILDEFKFKEVTAGNGWWGNKQGFQLGYKNFKLFGLENLFFQTEYNWVRPYLYSQRTPIKNYGHYNQPLAHPFGANFWESVNFIKYNYKRVFFSYQFIYSLYGEDPDGMNYGKDIYKAYGSHVSEYGNHIGQGIKTTLVYQNVSLSYLINPAYNLNFVVGYTNRNLKTDTYTQTTNYIYVGLRTSLRNLYYDF